MRQDLEDFGIGVSVLAPSGVAANIGDSERNRQQRFGGTTTGAQSPIVGQLLRETGISPDEVGERVIKGIEDNALYIFTHLEELPVLQKRHRLIEEAFTATRTHLEGNSKKALFSE